jgi:hypothetical protein
MKKMEERDFLKKCKEYEEKRKGGKKLLLKYLFN